MGLFNNIYCIFLFLFGSSTTFAQGQIMNACEIASNESMTLKVNGLSNAQHYSLQFKECPLDFSDYRYIAFEIENPNDQAVIVDINYKGNGQKSPARFILKPKTKTTQKIIINRLLRSIDKQWKELFDGVRGLPFKFVSHWSIPKPTNITGIDVVISTISGTPLASGLQLKMPYGEEDFNFYEKSPDDLPYPILDKFGQSVLSNWDGKIFKLKELKRKGEKDYKTFRNHKFDRSFSQYGGWINGPKRIAKGFFYTTKLNDKWWLVDPEGYIFWSFGVSGAGGSSSTSTKSREKLFPNLVAEQRLYATERNYTPTNRKLDMFKNNSINFYSLNLRRKYGPDWYKKHENVTAGRVKAWGLNTYGAWSVKPTDANHPYTIIIHPKLQGLGKLKKMVDPFSQEFQASLSEQLNKIKKFNKDPWLLGVFINNEIHWNKPMDIPNQVLQLENSNVPARKVFENFLKRKYGSIAQLNTVWKSNFKTFRSINNSSKDFSAFFKEDMLAFFNFYVETYYKTVSEKFKQVFPNHLYLGSRIHGKAKTNGPLHQIAAKYCDVISFNVYEYSIKDFKILADIDKPAIIGEFHFGTASDGVWGTGLRSAYSLKNQADLLQQYVLGAAHHPNFVGTHWFQWSDQPTTGRGGDGENFRIGIVNVTDRPYPILVDAIKSTSTKIYTTRLKP